MQCHQCAGRLKGLMIYCPYCGVRQQADLREVPHRNLGPVPQMACPRCESTLDRLEIGSSTKIEIEHCPRCHGIFLNPGELEAFLTNEVTDTIRIDLGVLEHLEQETDQHNQDHSPVNTGRHYLPCPRCQELMNPTNFGGRSSVMVDCCANHGIWLDGGELRRIAEWWRAGGRHFYQVEQEQLARRLSGCDKPDETPLPLPMTEMDDADHRRRRHDDWRPGEAAGEVLAGEALGWLLVGIFSLFN